MKHRLFFILFIFVTLFSYSQDLRFGIKGGLNIANLSDKNDYVAYAAKTGIHIGGMIEVPLRNKFALQSELLYSSEGAGVTHTQFDPWMGNVTYDLRLDYLRIPVLGKYYILKNLSAEGGLNLGMLLGAKYSGLSPEPIGYEPQKARKHYKSWDAQIALGAAYTLHSGIFLSLRYHIGIVDIDKYADKSLQANHTRRMSVFYISTGYSF